MTIALIVGTKKGAAILTSDSRRQTWNNQFLLKGWSVTASTRDDRGQFYAAITSDVFGAALMRSSDTNTWEQLEAAPRYQPGEKGNQEHIRIAGAGDFSGRYKDGPRLVDQIWTLHSAHSAVYAGVSEAGLFASLDQGKTWDPVDGFNNHPSRDNWVPGFGGLGAHTILSDRNDRNRMWVGVSAAGFFRTDDGGKTWVPKNDGVPGDTGQCVHHVAHDPFRADVLYRQEHRGVYSSRDGGDSWTVMENGLPVSELSDGHRCSFGFPIVLDRSSGYVFVAPLEGDNFRMPRDGQLAVYRSKQDGSWEGQTKGLPSNCYCSVLRGSMAADQLRPGGIYVGTSSGSVFASNDLGESWTEIASGLPRIQSIEVYVS
ncbi:MAG: exo-alpha-sialidase [Rhizomicrobium sp.]|jgi:photosystem II stability/assembly factor-like uncharacterized protein